MLGPVGDVLRHPESTGVFLTEMTETPSKSPASPMPGDTALALKRGIELFRGGRLADAERLMRRVIQHAPAAPDALHILGLAAARAGRLDEAERLLRRCVAVAPTYVDAHNNLGNVLMARGGLDAALRSYAEAARRAPDYVLPQYNLGNVLRALGRFEEAETAYRRALALAPDYADARVNLGNLLLEVGADAEAEAIALDLLAHRPDRPEVRLNLGNIYRRRGRLLEARTQYEMLLAVRPGHPRVLLSLVLLALDEHDLPEAERLFALVGDSQAAPAHERLAALALLRSAMQDKAGALDAALQADRAGGGPEHAVMLAGVLSELGNGAAAIKALRQTLARHGARAPRASVMLLDEQRAVCDWRDWERSLPEVLERIRGSDRVLIEPFSAQSLPGLSAADLCRIARLHARRLQPWMERGPLAGSVVRDPAPDRRLRIGYLSADLREHPTAYLSAGVFELHDRERFEIYAYAIGPTTDGPMRRRLRAAFDRFIELADLSHEAAARRIAADGIDILVDLGGYTKHSCPEILALRPAPIQVGWLGFPGTLGGAFMDYLIADRVVAPQEAAADYAETLVYLPHAYLPVDHRRTVGRIPSRAELGLPQEACVFGSFNQPHKLTPEVFACWCALLAAVPGSVLWIYVKDARARENLLREAGARGIDAQRLHFAGSCPQPEHLARLTQVDLILDTLPYNGHTTTSDAIWVGVPVLTCAGETWPSRVAAGLLTAAGLPELVVGTLDAYLERAIQLGNSPAMRADLRARLAASRSCAPFFDTPGFVRALEALYAGMRAACRTQQGVG